MLAGKVLEPLGAEPVAAHSLFVDAVTGGVTVFVAPPGTLLTDGLAAALEAVGRTPVWLRLGVEDRDPATFLATMITAVRRRAPGFGATLLTRVRAWPGPVHGWDDIFRRLGAELAERLPPDSALVLEHADRIDPHGPSLRLACGHVLGALPEATPRVLIGHDALPSTEALGDARRPPAEHARLHPSEVELPGRLGLWRRHAGVLLCRSAALRHAVDFVCATMPEGDLARALRGRTLVGVLTALARAVLAGATGAGRRMLARLLHVEYIVPEADRHQLAEVAGPWFQPLIGDWSRLRTVWRAPLLAALAEDASLDRETLRGTALELLRAGAPERAIPMLLEFDDRAVAARALARVAADMIAAGQWVTVGGWLDQLPPEAVEAEPDLLDAAAHVASARGQQDPARHRSHAAAAAVSETDRLARRLADIRRDRRLHAEAEAALARSEDETTALLHAHIASVSDGPGPRAPRADGATPGSVSFGLVPGPRHPGPEAIRRVDSPTGPPTGPPAGRLNVGGPVPPDAAGRVEMAVHVLGPLSVMVDGRPVRGWGARPRSLLAYLVIHRADLPPREVVTEALWPGADLPAARNNIQVAVYGARRALREAVDRQVIVFERGVYRLASDIAVAVDLDEFDGHVQAGQRLAGAGHVEHAIAELEAATALYRGDFLADARSEDWAVLRREQLRLAYLEALDRLSSLYLETRQYSVCALLCRQILERDPCREDAHRRLMRSYARQGQPHLALLQFRTCADVLARELRVAPGPATARLHERIRRHEPV
ncbi:transcriptional regulator, SARP family [Parafrankia sp. EAN1pec]|uniref:BTAD domain-containing putative transcriptional regulator n=1 Tax=Parafrankia sp. (strain EAN1pec) TaxID=298653 RepID=UPI00015DA040|nr:transcriptional regulator, SARP family [Frankia sp. EAN1pec]